MKISESEMEIMKILWKKECEMSSSEILNELGDIWKPTTVITFLKRLSEKGAVNVRREGKANYYSSKITKNEYNHSHTEEFVNTFHKGSVRNLLASLYDGKKPTKQELEDIKKWFEEV